MIDTLTRTLFGLFPRDVANPTRRTIWSLSDLNRFIEENDKVNDCFVSIYNDSTFDHDGHKRVIPEDQIVVDKVFFDFDNKIGNGDTQPMSTVLSESQAVARWLIAKGFQLIPVASGKKGIQIHTLTAPQTYSEPKKILRNFAMYVLESASETPFLTVDTHVIGDVRRICVPPQTLILGDNMSISDIKVGGTAFGGSRLDNMVHGTTSRAYTGTMTKVTASGVVPFTITPDHPLLCMTERYHSKLVKAQPSWKVAERLVPKYESVIGDYLLIPRQYGYTDIQELPLMSFTTRKHVITEKQFQDIHDLKARGLTTHEITTEMNLDKGTVNSQLKRDHFVLNLMYKRQTFPLNIETAWLMGLYVAEGYMKWSKSEGSQGFNLSLNQTENDIADKAREILRNVGYSTYIQRFKKTRAMCVICSSRVLGRAFQDWFGQGSHNKKIPDFIFFNTNSAVVLSFLEGYLCGDGSVINPKQRAGKRCMRTVSKILALQLQLLYARFGEFLHVREYDSWKGDKKYGKIYDMEIIGSRKHRHQVLDSYIATPVRSIEPVPYSGLVYNIETTDNTYLVSNVVVHNCRIPNTSRPPENNSYCTYIPVEMFLKMTVVDLYNWTKSRTYIDNFQLRPKTFENSLAEYASYEPKTKRYFNHNGNSGTELVMQPVTPSVLGTQNFLKPLLRPCIFTSLIDKDPRHHIRAAATIDLLGAGFSIDTLVHLYSQLGWVDYSEEETRTQITQLKEHGYEAYSCPRIRELGARNSCRCCF